MQKVHDGVTASVCDSAGMRRLMTVLAGLLFGLVSQVAAFWGAVLIATSAPLERFRNLGPGSVGDIILLLVLTLTLDAVLAGLLMLIFRRHRRSVLMVLLALTSACVALVAIGVLHALAVG